MQFLFIFFVSFSSTGKAQRRWSCTTFAVSLNWSLSAVSAGSALTRRWRLSHEVWTGDWLERTRTALRSASDVQTHFWISYQWLPRLSWGQGPQFLSSSSVVGITRELFEFLWIKNFHTWHRILKIKFVVMSYKIWNLKTDSTYKHTDRIKYA